MKKYNFENKVYLILAIVALVSSFLLFFYPDIFRILLAIVLLLWGLQLIIILFLDYVNRGKKKRKKNEKKKGD
ncbi:MAG: hypothetical protein WC867_05035 [Candidatus Pacearchaeota archaeon]|jgi:membrane protein YqaA with SNARE-associated domain